MRWLIIQYNFTYICPCAKSNGYLHGTHSIVSDGVTHLSLSSEYILLHCTYICPGAESNGYFYGTHSIYPNEVAHISLLT